MADKVYVIDACGFTTAVLPRIAPTPGETTLYSPFVTLQVSVTGCPGPPDEVAVKLLIVGFGPVGTFCDVYSGEISSTSKSEAVTFRNTPRLSLFQCESVVPPMNMELPLSAMMAPYCLRAVKMTWSSGG